MTNPPIAHYYTIKNYIFSQQPGLKEGKILRWIIIKKRKKAVFQRQKKIHKNHRLKKFNNHIFCIWQIWQQNRRPPKIIKKHFIEAIKFTFGRKQQTYLPEGKSILVGHSNPIPINKWMNVNYANWVIAKFSQIKLNKNLNKFP